MAAILILHYFWTGDLPGAAVVIDIMRRLPVTNKISPLIIARKISAEQSYYLFASLNEECIRAEEKGVEHARQSGVFIWEAQYHLVNASLAISSGNLKRAQYLFDSTSECLSAVNLVNNFQRSSYHCLVGHLALEKGNILISKLNLEKGLKYAHDAGVLSTEVINLAGMSQVLHESGDKVGAKKYLSKTRELGRRMNSLLFEFQCLIAEAQFALDGDKYEECTKALTMALALGRKGEYMYFVWWRPKIMARLYAFALEAGIEVEYVRTLIKKRNLYPETPPLDVEQWPWPVRIYTLGRFEVLIDDKPLKFSGKAPKKPLEMLKTLIACGGHEVSEARISDTLWPDAEGDGAHNAFTTTLRRLRKLI